MFCLKNVRYGDKILFTIGKLHNNASLTAAQSVHTFAATIRATTSINSSTVMTKGGKQQMSRFFATTIMPSLKQFNLMDYDIIGFDLDGTLLRYDLNNMVPLEHELLKDYLVKVKHYPKQLLDKKFEGNFLQKGLFIDTNRGNILKLSEDGTILKAAHGTKFMSDNDILTVYGESKQWDVAQEYLQDPLSAWNGPIAEQLRTLLDYFDIAASLVFAQTVDLLDECSAEGYTLGKRDYEIWPDMLDGLIQIYTREHFANGASLYFEALKGNPDKYLLKTDAKVVQLLRQLKASGKGLYLLTGSNIDFANFTASYALGPQWCELFDYVVGFAKKPGFFFGKRQFLKVSNLNEVVESEIALNAELPPNTCYSQGNWPQLKESLCKKVLQKDPQQVKSLYVGDNLIQDVYTPNVVAGMDTLALSEELLENDNNYEFKTIVQSPLWGSYFSENGGTATLWSNIIEKHSQLCVSVMDAVVEVPVNAK